MARSRDHLYVKCLSPREGAWNLVKSPHNHPPPPPPHGIYIDRCITINSNEAADYM